MLDWDAVPPLGGELHQYPLVESGTDVVAEHYEILCETHAPEDILVLSRFPSGLDAIDRALRDRMDIVRSPNLVSLAAHAHSALGYLEDGPDVLSETERTALLRDLIRDADWSGSEYLRRASSGDGFVDDVERFVTEASWQGVTVRSERDPALNALGELLSRYQRRLRTMNAIDHQGLTQYVTRSYQRSELATGDPDGSDDEADPEAAPVATFDDDPRAEFEAILVVDFEEFTPIDRAYLSYIGMDTEVVCLATANASIQRVWNEAGQIAEKTELTNETEADDEVIERLEWIDALAHYLATDEKKPTYEGEEKPFWKITGTTFRDQLRAVAAEINRRVQQGYSYDDFAVVFRDSKSPIEDAVDELWRMGIPSDSTTVEGMEHDPAARELYHLSCLLAELPAGADLRSLIDRETITVESILETARSDERRRIPSLALDRSGVEYRLSRLIARVDTDMETDFEGTNTTLNEPVPLDIDEICQGVAAAAECERLDAALEKWIERTQLIHRVARDEDRQTARQQFADVQRVLELARFHEETTHLKSTWNAYKRALTEEMDRSGTDRVPTDQTTQEGTVMVDATRVFKNESKRFVFVLDLVEGEFPAAPQFNRLFSPARLAELPEYPALTNPSEDQVYATFRTEGREMTSNNPQRAYYYALHRRFLAVAAGIAREGLYLGTYEEEGGILGDTKQESRFLRRIEAEFGNLSEPDRTTIRTRGEAKRYVLTRVDRALDAARRSVAIGETVDMAAVETEFRIAQRLLADLAEEEETLHEGIHTQIKHAAGEVIRDE